MVILTTPPGVWCGACPFPSPIRYLCEIPPRLLSFHRPFLEEPKGPCARGEGARSPLLSSRVMKGACVFLFCTRAGPLVFHPPFSLSGKPSYHKQQKLREQADRTHTSGRRRAVEREKTLSGEVLSALTINFIHTSSAAPRPAAPPAQLAAPQCQWLAQAASSSQPPSPQSSLWTSWSAAGRARAAAARRRGPPILLARLIPSASLSTSAPATARSCVRPWRPVALTGASASRSTGD